MAGWVTKEMLPKGEARLKRLAKIATLFCPFVILALLLSVCNGGFQQGFLACRRRGESSARWPAAPYSHYDDFFHGLTLQKGFRNAGITTILMDAWPID